MITVNKVSTGYVEAHYRPSRGEFPLGMGANGGTRTRLAVIARDVSAQMQAAIAALPDDAEFGIDVVALVGTKRVAVRPVARTPAELQAEVARWAAVAVELAAQRAARVAAIEEKRAAARAAVRAALESAALRVSGAEIVERRADGAIIVIHDDEFKLLTVGPIFSDSVPTTKDADQLMALRIRCNELFKEFEHA